MNLEVVILGAILPGGGDKVGVGGGGVRLIVGVDVDSKPVGVGRCVGVGVMESKTPVGVGGWVIVGVLVIGIVVGGVEGMLAHDKKPVGFKLRNIPTGSETKSTTNIERETFWSKDKFNQVDLYDSRFALNWLIPIFILTN